MDNRYNCKNRRKYSLKVHIVLVTKYRKLLIKGSIVDDVKQKIFDTANIKDYKIIAMETDKDHIHFLLEYDTTDRACDIAKTIKQETTHYLWQKYNNFLSKEYWKKKIFWSDGYFACSIGEVSSATKIHRNPRLERSAYIDFMKIAICDDNIQSINYVEEYIEQLPLKDISHDVFMTGNDLINYLKNSSDSFSIYFLDIEMPGSNGIEVASFIRKNDSKCLIIFITEHKDYVYQVFEVLPFRFIVKPLTKERLNTVLHEAIEHIQTMQQLFFFKIERRNFQIPFEDILYFEGCGRKIRLLTKSAEYEFYEKVSNIKEKIDKNLFLQIHTSYIVNMEHIRSITETEVILKINIHLPISKKFRKVVKVQHLNFMEWRCGR